MTQQNEPLASPHIISQGFRLDTIYPYQFIMHETTDTDAGESNVSIHALDNDHVVSGTVSGAVYQNGHIVQTFRSHNFDNSIITNEFADPPVWVTSLQLNHSTGKLRLEWSEAPGPHHCVVSYEYAVDGYGFVDHVVSEKTDWAKNGF
jgi:hypothetical protein